MKDIFKKQNKKGINPLAAAVAGVAVGVGAAIATTNVLKDKKNRKKLDNFVSDVKNRASDVKQKTTEYFENSKEAPKAKRAVKKVVKKSTKKK